MDWINDGHTIQAKYSDKPCTVVMIVNCPGQHSDPACDVTDCHVRLSSAMYGWEVFAGHEDFDLIGIPMMIEWCYVAEDEIQLRKVAI